MIAKMRGRADTRAVARVLERMKSVYWLFSDAIKPELDDDWTQV